MREIKGPEDCIPRDNCDGFMDSIRGRDSVDAWFTAQEVGQIISLAMDAAWYECDEWSDDEEDKIAQSWRDLADKLKAGANG